MKNEKKFSFVSKCSGYEIVAQTQSRNFDTPLCGKESDGRFLK